MENYKKHVVFGLIFAAILCLCIAVISLALRVNRIERYIKETVYIERTMETMRPERPFGHLKAPEKKLLKKPRKFELQDEKAQNQTVEPQTESQSGKGN